jgi:uncharacterized protein (TIGR02147 family)
MKLEFDTDKNYRVWLKELLTKRQQENPMYSLRAFARDLEVSRSALHSALQLKSDLSKANISNVAKKLGLSKKFYQQMLNSAGHSSDDSSTPKHEKLAEKDFECLANWYTWGLLSLVKLPDCQDSAVWVAKRFAISEPQAQEAIDTLKKLGFIQTSKGNKLVKTTLDLDTGDFTYNKILTDSKISDLKKAAEVLKETPSNKRSHVSVTLVADPALAPVINKMNRAYLHKISKLLSTCDQKEVYNLTMMFYPLTCITNSEPT